MGSMVTLLEAVCRPTTMLSASDLEVIIVHTVAKRVYIERDCHRITHSSLNVGKHSLAGLWDKGCRQPIHGLSI